MFMFGAKSVEAAPTHDLPDTRHSVAAPFHLHVEVRPECACQVQHFIRAVCKERLLDMSLGREPGTFELLIASGHAAFAENLALALSALPNVRRATPGKSRRA